MKSSVKKLTGLKIGLKIHNMDMSFLLQEQSVETWFPEHTKLFLTWLDRVITALLYVGLIGENMFY